jgi:mycothiol synthase
MAEAQLMMTHPGPLHDLPDVRLPSGCQLRTASRDDADALGRVIANSFQEPWDADRVHRVLFEPADVLRVWVVVDAKQEIQATASERLLPDLYGDAGYVHYVATHERSRGLGLGEAVTLAVLRGFTERGIVRAVLETDDFRQAAIRLYLRLGFIPEYRDDNERAAWSTLFKGPLANHRPHRPGEHSRPA